MVLPVPSIILLLWCFQNWPKLISVTIPVATLTPAHFKTAILTVPFVRIVQNSQLPLNCKFLCTHTVIWYKMLSTSVSWWDPFSVWESPVRLGVLTSSAGIKNHCIYHTSNHLHYCNVLVFPSGTVIIIDTMNYHQLHLFSP